MNPKDRMLPASLEVEKAVLGACISDPAAWAFCKNRLSETHFHFAVNQVIWKTVASSEDHPDLIVVSQALRDAGKSEDTGGDGYLTDLLLAAPTTAYHADHVAILEEKAVARQLIAGAWEVMEQAYSAANSPQLAADAVRMFSDISGGLSAKRSSTLRPLSASGGVYREWTRRSHEQALNLSRWLPSLRHHADRLTGGELVTIIGDTGVGKSALCQNIADAAAPLKVAVFELELPETLMYPRQQQLIRGLTLHDVWQQHHDGAAEDWHEDRRIEHIWLDTTAGLSVDEIERRVSSHNAAHPDDPFRVVIVDYFQLLRGKGKTRYEQYSNEAEAAKVAAKRTNSVWILVSQIGRPDSDGVHEPQLHDGKETGSIENSSGLVLGAWRDEHDASIMYLRVLKNTKGKSGLKITCNYTGPTLRITERIETR